MSVPRSTVLRVGMAEPAQQAEQDTATAWWYAANCLLYEHDRGPARLNIGSTIEPVRVDRSHAWQDAYAHFLLEALAADLTRLRAAARHYRAKLTFVGTLRHTTALFRARRPEGLRQALGAWSPRHVHDIRQGQHRALDLCEQAAQIIVDAGADTDDITRRRLLAGTRHANTMLALGTIIPQVAQDSTDRLTAELNALDGEHHQAAPLRTENTNTTDGNSADHHNGDNHRGVQPPRRQPPRRQPPRRQPPRRRLRRAVKSPKRTSSRPRMARSSIDMAAAAAARRHQAVRQRTGQTAPPQDQPSRTPYRLGLRQPASACRRRPRRRRERCWPGEQPDRPPPARQTDTRRIGGRRVRRVR